MENQVTKLDSLLLHDRDPIVEKFNGQGQSAASAGVGPSSETYIASGGLLCDVPKQAKRRKLMRDSSWPTQHYTKHGAKWAGGLRAGGLRAGGLRAGGPRAGGPRAGGPRAGGPRAGGLRAGRPKGREA